jgi:Tfp pilus assembly PilM family ATPase
VQSDCLALHNALAHELLTEGANGADAIAAIDVGTEGTNLVVSSQRGAWFRSFTPGGGNFTRALTQELKLTYDQAEQFKREPARARSFCRLEAAIQPLLTQLAGEVERSLATYSRLYADQPVNRVYGLGGGFQILGMLRHLRTGK